MLKIWSKIIDKITVKWYNIITGTRKYPELNSKEMMKMLKKIEKVLDQLDPILKKIDKLVYRLIQIAGTIGILILAIKTWFN